jgi:hypothetical protein
MPFEQDNELRDAMSTRISNRLHGVINGKTIELTEDPGVPAGQEVEVLVSPLPDKNAGWGAGLRRCSGALANEWTDEDDLILEEIYQERKHDRRAELIE